MINDEYIKAMSEEIVSASGERVAIGGYLPRFDEFAWFIYLNLINNKLKWIRVCILTIDIWIIASTLKKAVSLSYSEFLGKNCEKL